MLSAYHKNNNNSNNQRGWEETFASIEHIYGTDAGGYGMCCLQARQVVCIKYV